VGLSAPKRQFSASGIELTEDFATLASGASVRGNLIEVTSLDVRCLVEANPEIGDTIQLSIPTQDDVQVTSVEGLVHWKEMRRHGYEIGVFVAQGVPQRLMNLGTADNRRAMSRYRCRVAGTISGAEVGGSTEAVAVNYSFEGMALQIPVSCPMNEVITFEWEDSRGCQKIDGVALWQIEQNDGFLIGCQLQPGAGLTLGGLNMSQAR
jgi:hypothetical protein